MGRQARHKKHRGNGEAKVKKTKRRTKDIDQIFDEIQPNNIEKVKKEKTQLDEDLPGLGQYYCISCARYFMKDNILQEHFKTKSHKRK